MQCCPDLGEPVTLYALVSYVPGELGKYLDGMRRDLVSSCLAQSHVTVLPPRRIEVDPAQAKLQLQAELPEFAPFRVDLTRVEVFESSRVIYVAVGSGSEELQVLHSRLNRNGFAFNEPFLFHPHLTLAQTFPEEELAEKLERAKQQWADCPYEKSFLVDHLTFVRSPDKIRWMDLDDFRLGTGLLAGALR